MSTNEFTPCTDLNCQMFECVQAREEALANTEVTDVIEAEPTVSELLNQVEEYKAKAERYERFYGNKIQAISNFETAVKDLLEEDDETVSWDSLERALQYLDIEVTSTWTATFTVEFQVSVRARAEDRAREILDSVYSFSVDDREIDDYSTESYDWSDLERND
jgi:hypothetical protein